ncbi:hypothetical protein [Pontibacter arcticus]|nr:hypothetical protein [Pontibacter arcticus]
MQPALAVCFHQQAPISRSIVVGENTNNGATAGTAILYTFV